MHEAPPDHSTLSRTRRLIDLETHQAVFTWVLQRLADATLVVGRTVGIDATTLEANAAMRSIVRRDTGESYDAFLTRLAEASGLSTPTRAELARFDRTRKKKGSNADWTHPHDPVRGSSVRPWDYGAPRVHRRRTIDDIRTPRSPRLLIPRAGDAPRRTGSSRSPARRCPHRRALCGRRVGGRRRRQEARPRALGRFDGERDRLSEPAPHLLRHRIVP